MEPKQSARKVLSPALGLCLAVFFTTLPFLAGGQEKVGPDAAAQGDAKGTRPSPFSKLTSRPGQHSAAFAGIKVGEEIVTGAGQRRRLELADGSILLINQRTALKLIEPTRLLLTAGEVYVEIPSSIKDQSALTLVTPHRELSGGGSHFNVRVDKAGTEVVVARGGVDLKGSKTKLLAGQRLPAGENAVVDPYAPCLSQFLDWTRELMLAAESPLIPGSQHAGGALIAIDPRGQEAKLQLRKFHIDVVIEDGFARTTIDQTYFNQEAEQLEGTFYFPLPADASLSRLAMYVDGVLREGGMAERDHARQTYESIRYYNRDPALLEWVDGSTFKMRVFPIEARQEKRLVLSYSQVLTNLNGQMQYRFPAGHSLQMVKDWSFRAHIKNGKDFAWSSPSHNLQKDNDRKADSANDLVLSAAVKNARTNQDVVLKLSTPETAAIRFSTTVQDGAHYFMMRYRPDFGDIAKRQAAAGAGRRDWVFLFEASGDRDPLLARVQIDVIRHLLHHAGPDDHFNILTANTRVKAWSKKLMPVSTENVASALAFLEGTHLIGALDLGQAFRESAKFLAMEAENPHLVHLGSGIAAMGERRVDEMIGRTTNVWTRWERLLAMQTNVLSGTKALQQSIQSNADKKPTEANIQAARRLAAKEMEIINEATKAAEFLEDIGAAVAFTDLFRQLREEMKEVHRRLNDADVGPKQAALQEGIIDAFQDMVLPKGSAPATTRYVGIGVGRRWDRAFMKESAQRTGGFYTQINPDEEIPWRTFELFASLNMPRLLDIAVSDPASKAIFLPLSRAASQGEDVCAVGKLSGDRLPDKLVITGQLGGKAWTKTIAVNNVTKKADYLPRTWAKLQIDRLLAEDALKNKDEIIALSKAMYVMTPFTSLLVLENDDQHAQYKIDFGRKDHWAMYPCPAKIDIVYEPLEGMPDRKSAAGQKPTAKQVLRTIAGSEQVDMAEIRRISEQWGSLPPRSGQSAGIPFLSTLPSVGRLGKTFTSVSNTIGGSNITGGSLAGFGSVTFGKMPPVFAPAPALPASAHSLRFQAPLPGEPIPAPAKSPASRFRELREDPGVVDAPDGGEIGADWGSAQTRSRVVMKTVMESESVTIEKLSRKSRRAGQDHPRGPDGEVAHNPDFLYRRPTFELSAAVFFDLTAHAPGMASSMADLDAVLEAEARPQIADRPGTIDPDARKLFAKARDFGWQAWTLPADEGGFTIVFDGSGKYAYERNRETTNGILEVVACDGQTLLHLYPQLGIGAQRNVSRFHRADFADVVPWALPDPADLAHGADLKMVGERIVAIVPHQDPELRARTESLSLLQRWAMAVPSWYEVHLVFAADGKLSERRLVKMPADEDSPTGKILSRRVFGADGVVKLFDVKGKEVSVIKGKLNPAKAPDLSPSTKDLVVLPLPYRTPEHVANLLREKNVTVNNASFKDALPLFAAYFAAGNASEANNVFRQVFHSREQRQLGFYVLLAGCGLNLDSQHGDVLAEHLENPVAQYLALHSSPVLRQHASQWAMNSDQWQEGLLQHLGLTHAILQRWQSDKVLKGDPAKVAAEKRRALDYVKKHKESAFAWVLLSQMQDRADKEPASPHRESFIPDEGNSVLRQNREFHLALAECWNLFAGEEADGKQVGWSALRYAARYERARSMHQAGKTKEARAAFRQLYERALKDNILPPIDEDFRRCLQVNVAEDPWSRLMNETAAELIKKKHRPAVLSLARQVWRLEDQPLAQHLLSLALAVGEPGAPPGEPGASATGERVEMTLAVIDLLREKAQIPEADELLQKLLGEKKLAERPELWRLASALAESRDMPARSIECLEKALDLEFRPIAADAVVDLEQVRTDYRRLLRHYESLADAMVALKLPPPEGFLAKVVRGADRWRALDAGSGDACRMTAHILQRLGENELGWDYLTTPVGMNPSESGAWWNLGWDLSKKGELTLADRAYEAAFAAEPTNAQILWDRAQNLRQAGQTQAALRLYRQLADGTWQPRFQGLQTQARLRVKGS